MKLLALAASLALCAFATAQTDTKCTFQTFGDSCGPRLHGVFRTSDTGRIAAVIEVTKAPKHARGVLVLGVQRLAVSLPNRCRILVLPIVVLPMNTNRAGSARQIFAVPPKAKGTVLFQTGHLAGDRGIVTSNGLAGTCK